MTRIVLKDIDRQMFFNCIKEKSLLSSDDIGKIVGISGRSYRDWMNGKTLPTEAGLKVLSNRFQVTMPSFLESREEHWVGRIYGSKAGKAYYAKYGYPGNVKSRAKGGRISQRKRNENPGKYRLLGCIVANEFKDPEDMAKLAEFIGIVLGDGGLTRTQCHITLHLFDDAAYSIYVKQLIRDLFDYDVSIGFRWKYTGREMVITGVNFVKLMQKYGLDVGDKVKHQVAIPDWIKKNNEWYTACIRGLFDTDGGTFTHIHRVNGRCYVNFGITFTNASQRLRDDFKLFLENYGIKFGESKLNILVYNKPGIQRFFELVSPRNQKHIQRYRGYVD